MLMVMAARGCVWESLSGGSLIVTYYDDNVTPEQWSAYMRLMQALKGRESRHLIYVVAAPPREFLSQITTVARGQPWQVALLSSSTAVRFAASTFSLIVRGFRFFPPDRIGDALKHLQCTVTEQDEARKALIRCRGMELSVPPS
jgi:hypothetical protein